MAAAMNVLVGTAGGVIDAGSGRVVALEGEDVGAMAPGWAVTGGRRVVSLDGARGAVLDGPLVTCVDAGLGGEPLLGTAGAHLYRLGTAADPELVQSFDRVEGRSDWYTPWGGPADVRSVSTAPSGAILVNVHVGGILRSGDGGQTWSATIDLDHDVHQVLGLDGMVAVAACAHGLASSRDDGMSWAVEDAGLHATYGRAVALAGASVLLSVSTGPQGRHAALYRWPLGAGGAFERCRAGLPEWFDGNVDTFCLAGAPDGTAALVTRAGEVYVSSDEGRTWEQAATRLASPSCLVMG